MIMEVGQFILVELEILSVSMEQASMETQQTQEMVMIFTGMVASSPSTIRALLPTLPMYQW
jgi:hypothetical protein